MPARRPAGHARLPEPGTLHCTVVDEGGRALTNAPLNVYPLLDSGVADWLRRVILRTNAAGRAEVRLFPGPYAVAIHSSTGRDMVGDPTRFWIEAGERTEIGFAVR